MSNQELLAYGIAALGGIMALYATLQLYKKGFLLWVLLLVVGITGLNYGLTNKSVNGLDGLLAELTPARLSAISKDTLSDLCKQGKELPEVQVKR